MIINTEMESCHCDTKKAVKIDQMPLVTESVNKYDVTGLTYRFAPSQWKTPLQSDALSHWLGASLESALC